MTSVNDAPIGDLYSSTVLIQLVQETFSGLKEMSNIVTKSEPSLLGIFGGSP